MHLDLTDEQKALQLELREYFNKLVTAEKRVEQDEEEEMGDAWQGMVHQMGKDGWLGIGWPKEFGAQGRGPVDQLIFYEEAGRAGAPIPLVTINTVGPTLAQYGTDEQKAFFLPKILAGEIQFAIGYSEPEAGTDLASLRTRAVRVDGTYIVNGQKVFTTGGHVADYVWLACRTDPDAPKHRGISILIVDTNDPGYSSTPIHTLAGGFTNATYYQDVRVPLNRLVGEENGGWRMITTQLNFERVALGPAGRLFRQLDAVTGWAKETKAPDGRRMIDQEWVRINLATVRAKAEACSLMNWRIAALQEHGGLRAGDASALKVFGTELRIEVNRLLMEVLGPEATIQKGSPRAMFDGLFEVTYRGAIVGTFGGGVNEVQREIIGAAGLGMPRVPR
ncbi:MAG: acyl-CoA dehydrogenase family protein [Actinomycetota bacterium]